VDDEKHVLDCVRNIGFRNAEAPQRPPDEAEVLVIDLTEGHSLRAMEP
jgi:hypothetical protein